MLHCFEKKFVPRKPLIINELRKELGAGNQKVAIFLFTFLIMDVMIIIFLMVYYPE